MRSYDFPATTNAIYNLWMHEFANFYLELAKAVIRNGKPKEQAACRNVLYKVMSATQFQLLCSARGKIVYVFFLSFFFFVLTGHSGG